MLEDEIYPRTELSLINEEFQTLNAEPQQLDLLWANGWRHFGTHFFRYNLSFYEGRICRVFPLRINLSAFSLSKSKRRIIKKNRDLESIIRPIVITPEKQALFERHKYRFKRGIPHSLYDFLSTDAATIPCQAMEVCIYNDEKLLAVSFFDLGETAISSIYAMFEPGETTRSLGIFTMLVEIDFALNSGKSFYYQGYAYEGKSFYDYKKRFRAVEKFDWNGKWENFQEEI